MVCMVRHEKCVKNGTMHFFLGGGLQRASSSIFRAVLVSPDHLLLPTPSPCSDNFLVRYVMMEQMLYIWVVGFNVHWGMSSHCLTIGSSSVSSWCILVCELIIVEYWVYGFILVLVCFRFEWLSSIVYLLILD